MKGNDYIRDSGHETASAPRAKSIRRNRICNSISTPKAMLDRLTQLRGIMFPNECSPWEANRASLGKRGTKPFRKRLPPLEDDCNGCDDGHGTVRMNTFYQAPVGEENFQIRHLKAICGRPIN